MLDLGTALAILSIALEAAKGLVTYYELWKDCDRDVKEARNSLLWVANIFTQLDITLRQDHLKPSIASTIRITAKACESGVEELHALLDKAMRDGSPKGLIQKLKAQGRRACFPFRASTITRLLELVEDLKDDLNLAIDLLCLDTTAQGLRSLDTIDEKLSSIGAKVDFVHGKMHRNIIEDERHEVLTWLKPADQSATHRLIFETRQPHTGEWLLESDTIHNWEAEGKKFIWLYGSVGCGKSVICSSIVERVKKLCSVRTLNKRPNTLFYFYFAFDGPQNRYYEVFLKSALAQLCAANGVHPLLRELYLKSRTPSLSDLEQTLISILTDFGEDQHEERNILVGKTVEHETYVLTAGKAFFVIDALDEVLDHVQRELIIRFLNMVTGERTLNTRIFVTSRLELDIADEFRSCGRWVPVRMEQAQIQQDIGTFVNARISQDRKLSLLSDKMKGIIRHRLITGANGMFRWAALQIQDLARLRVMRPCDITKTLELLPKDLDATYERILARIEDIYSSEALAALKWLTLAARPLFLEEVLEAAIVQLGTQSPVDEERRLGPADLLTILTGLVTLDPPLEHSHTFQEKQHVLSLAHFSVREFLMNERTKNSVAKAFTINTSISEDFITQSSLEYIRHCAKSRAEYRLLPLIKYASSHWGRHLSCISSDHNEQACQLAFAIFNDLDLASFWLCIERDKFQPEPLGRGTRLYPTAIFWKCYPLWVSVTSGILRLSELFLSANSPVEDMPTMGYFLVAAVRRKDVMMVKLLLKHKANPTGALLSAIEVQKDDIIQELISHNVRATPREFVRAARISSGNAIEAILTTAEDIGYEDLAIALGESLTNRDGRLTEILMSDLTNSSGRFPNKHPQMLDRDYIYWHLNRIAASNNLPKVVTLLAGSRSSFQISTHNLEFVLVIAAEAGYSGVARAVLSAPGLIWSAYALTSAAITATRGMHSRVVGEIYPYLSVRDITECKLFHVAISVGCRPVIHRLLIGKFRSQGSGYWNDDKALLLAALRDDDVTVTKLLSNGAARASLDSLADANVRRQLIKEMLELGSGSGKIDPWRLVAGGSRTAMDYQFSSASIGLNNAQIPQSMSLVPLRARPSPGTNSKYPMALVLQNGMSQLKMALLGKNWQLSLFAINVTLRKAGLLLDVEFTSTPSDGCPGSGLREWLPTGNMFISHENGRTLFKISVRDMVEKRKGRRKLIGPSRPPSGFDGLRVSGLIRKSERNTPLLFPVKWVPLRLLGLLRECSGNAQRVLMLLQIAQVNWLSRV